MPIYANVDSVDIWQELAARIRGYMTFIRVGPYLVTRDSFNIHRDGPAYVEHEHRTGFVELERQCQTATSKKEIDSSLPPF